MSAPLKNDLFLKALLCQPTPRTPVWMMRQAGRYLPEYRATRGRAGSFLNLCMNPDLACEVTLQPLERFPLDAAILFSDILTIPHAMGLGLEFEAGEGPKLERPVRTAADVHRLPVPHPERELKYVIDGDDSAYDSLYKLVSHNRRWLTAPYLDPNNLVEVPTSSSIPFRISIADITRRFEWRRSRLGVYLSSHGLARTSFTRRHKVAFLAPATSASIESYGVVAQGYVNLVVDRPPPMDYSHLERLLRVENLNACIRTESPPSSPPLSQAY